MRSRSVLLLAALLACTSPRVSRAEDILHTERSLYRQIVVYQEGSVRCMRFTRLASARQSCVDLADRPRLVFEYLRMMIGALYLAPAPQSVLVIGLGGGTLVDALQRTLPDAAIDAVELDPAVVRVAKAYFDFQPGPRTHVHEEDGRVFVKRALRAGRRYDLVMLDAYDHEYIPEHMLTREFLEEVKGILAPHGVVAANTFSGSRLYDHESATYAAVFGRFFNLKRSNRVILLRKDGLPDTQTLRANADTLRPKLGPTGIDPAWLLSLFDTRVDWPADARVLTDRYSPSNLLNASPP
ncbi:MAG TPA: fused MFS/spermidine synthase [Casimicrobiaceae bacterium]|jgi:spermidine synthase|nr:fused MFS/spermidine synthase [Casimicrobiaceae bacterium]